MRTQQIAKLFPETRFVYSVSDEELLIDLYSDGCITLKIFEENTKQWIGVLENYFNYYPKHGCASSSHTTAAQNFHQIDEIACRIGIQRISVLDAHRYVVKGIELTSNLVDLLSGEMPFYIRKWPGCGYFYKDRNYQFALNTILPQLIHAASDLIRIDDRHSLQQWVRGLRTEFLHSKTKKHARFIHQLIGDMESTLGISTLMLKEKEVVGFLDSAGSIHVDDGNKDEILRTCLRILLIKCQVGKFFDTKNICKSN